MASGWIALHRKILDNPIWNMDKYSKAQAFLDLVLRANHKDNSIFIGNQEMLIKRGQILTSQSKLAERWGWDRKTVKFFILFLTRERMVLYKTDRKIQHGFTLITIINYDAYQDIGQQDTQQIGQQRDSKKDTNNNVNNVNNNYLPKDEEKKSKEIPLFRTREYLIEFKGQDMADLLKEYWLPIDGVRAKGRQLYEYYDDGKFKSGKPIKDFKKLFRNIIKKDASNIIKQYGRQEWL